MWFTENRVERREIGWDAESWLGRALGNRVEHRSFVGHGGIITDEDPSFLNEASVTHAITALRDWRGKCATERTNFAPPKIYLDAYTSVILIKVWF